MVLELLQRCDINEYGEPDSELAELLRDWDLIDLPQDTWLVFSSEEELIAYAAVIPRGARLQFDTFVSPDWIGDDLGLDLLARSEERSRAVAAALGVKGSITAVSYIAHVNTRASRTLSLAGFSPEKYHFQMQMNLERTLLDPVWPAGLTTRTAWPQQDAYNVYQLIQAAFARPGRFPQPYEEWETYMLRPGDFDPELWFLAFDHGGLVGVCLCYQYEEIGWVRQLGVDEPWRRRGLGTAFLRHAFKIFRVRGFRRVGLGVEAANPAAYAFYQEIGMERKRQYDEYTKRITVK
jgi:GNAT superfamily N-acetyltransferase